MNESAKKTFFKNLFEQSLQEIISAHQETTLKVRENYILPQGTYADKRTHAEVPHTPKNVKWPCQEVHHASTVLSSLATFI